MEYRIRTLSNYQMHLRNPMDSNGTNINISNHHLSNLYELELRSYMLRKLIKKRKRSLRNKISRLARDKFFPSCAKNARLA